MANCEIKARFWFREIGMQPVTLDLDVGDTEVAKDDLPSTADGGFTATHICLENALDGLCPNIACQGDLKFSFNNGAGYTLEVVTSYRQPTGVPMPALPDPFGAGDHTHTFQMVQPECGQKTVWALLVKSNGVPKATISVTVECEGC